MRKDLLWFPVSEVSVHAHWTLCFWACDEAVPHSGRAWQRKAVTLMATTKQSETERGSGQGRDTLFKGILPPDPFPQIEPHLLQFALPPNNSSNHDGFIME
jgi:hypothetical protein